MTFRHAICTLGIAALSLGAVACSDNNDDMPSSSSNTAPEASIDVEMEATVGDTVTASGADSTDADGDSLTYTWTLDTPSASSASLSDTAAQAPSFDADTTGIFRLTLVVSDGTDSSEPVTAEVTVTEPVDENEDPVADAGDDVTVTINDTVTLDGSGSTDPDGDDLSYAWAITTAPTDSAATLTDETVPDPSFVPDIAGTYEVTLTVDDGMGGTDTDTVLVTAEAGMMNTPPMADAGDDAMATVGMEVTLDGTNSVDPDGDDLTFSWAITTDPSNGADSLSDADTDTATITPSVAGEYVFTLTVTDPDGEADSDEVTITVSDVMNLPPMADAGMDTTGMIGMPVTLDGSASTDPEGAALTYQWDLTTTPNNSTALFDDATVAQPSFTPDVEGVYIATLTVTDDEGNTGDDTVEVTVAGPSNTPPMADAGMNASVVANTQVTLDGSMSMDVEDGVNIDYDWTISSQPANANVMLSDATIAQPTFTPVETGNYVFSLTVTDSQGATDSDTVTITVTNQPNTNPVADAGADQTVAVQMQVTVDASGSMDAEDAANALTYNWVITTQPTGSAVNLSDVNAVAPTFTPIIDGTYTLEVTVTDTAGANNTDSVTITATNMAPVADAGADQNASQGNLVTLDASGSTDAEDDAANLDLSYSWALITQPATSNVTLNNPMMASATFIPSEAGTYEAEVTVTDSAGATATDTVIVTVAAANTPPTAVASDRGVAIGSTVKASAADSFDAEDDAAGTPLNYQWTLISEPTNSSITLTGEMSAVIEFTPVEAGDYLFDLTVTDSQGASNTISVTITAYGLAADALLISEVIEGSSFNKAVELFNNGNASLELQPYTLCVINNDDTTCTRSEDLQGTLMQGETYQICESRLDRTLLPANVSCDIDSGVTGFNGDDRLLLFVDQDGDGVFGTGDVPVDAFGQIDMKPAQTIWADKAYRRCDLTEYSGMTSATVTTYYNEVGTQDDFSDFGTAPPANPTCNVASNTPPVADAGMDQTVQTGTQVTLDGTGSSDAEDAASALTYQWAVVTEPSSANVTLTGDMTDTATFTPSIAGVYSFELSVTDTQGATTTDTVGVTVNAQGNVGPGDLIISEYLEGSSNNKALELYNLSATETADLTGYVICIARNADTTCSAYYNLSGTLAPQSTLVLCNNQFDPAEISRCDETDSFFNFNGDDRILLFDDVDGSGDFNTGDTAVDAFGNIAVPDSSDPWEDVTHRRCSTNKYTDTTAAAGAYMLSNYFSPDAGTDDFSDLGMANFPGCGGGPANTSPTADAGTDQTVITGVQVTLDASNSTDPEDDAAGTPLMYQWSVTSEPSGANVSLANAMSAAATFTPTITGTYTFEVVVTDSQGAIDTDTVDVTVTMQSGGSAGDLIISEYIEDGGNKALELFNTGTQAVDLSNVLLCVVANSNTTCNSNISLSGILATQDTLVICNSSIPSATCDVTNGSLSFNGNDRILLYEDVDASGGFNTGDTPVDSFGNISIEPMNPASPWEDVTLRRCNPMRYTNTQAAQGGFTAIDYFTELPNNMIDFTDLGSASITGCP